MTMLTPAIPMSTFPLTDPLPADSGLGEPIEAESTPGGLAPALGDADPAPEQEVTPETLPALPAGEEDRPLEAIEASSDPFDDFEDDDFDDEFDDDFEEDWDDEEEDDGFGPEFQDSEGEEFDVNAEATDEELEDEEEEEGKGKGKGKDSSRFSGDKDFDE